MTNFIFMLTHHDLTIPNALEIFEEVKHTSVSHIGFKDVGLPMGKLKRLAKLIRKEGISLYLEVVSETQGAMIQSTKRAIELEVDYLIGGTYPEKMLRLIEGTRIKCFPYIGQVVDHPCQLRGTIEEIMRDAERVEKLGVDGINLLAYRYNGNVDKLITAIQNSVEIPLIIAGSIDSFERIQKLRDMGIFAFTIGGAVMEKRLVSDGSISDQILSVLRILDI